MAEYEVVERKGEEVLVVYLNVTGLSVEERRCLLEEIEESYNIIRRLHDAEKAM